MIFAAGLGTRLYPITQSIPKALVEVGGKPIIERVILNLKSAGVSEIIINLHHFPEQIKSFLSSKNNFDLRIAFSEENDQALETGGGLKKAAWFFDDGQPFFVHNADILTNLDLSKLMAFHQERQPLATLFVEARQSSRYLLFDPAMQLSGWTNKKTGEIIISRNTDTSLELAFNGTHIIDPRIFDLINMDGKFSIIPLYLELARQHTILGYGDENAFSLDIGKAESLEKAERILGESGV